MVVKFNTNLEVEWKYIYGESTYADVVSSLRTQTWSVLELPNNQGYLLGGCQRIIGDTKSKIIRIDANGMLVSITDYLPHAMITGLTKYFDGENWKYYASGFSYNTFNFVGEISIDGVGPFESNNFKWLRTFDHVSNSSTKKNYVFDLEMSSEGNILVPAIGDIEIVGDYSDGGKGVGHIYRYSRTGDLINSILVDSSLKAYDLKIGITSTLDGGFAVVSTKQPIVALASEYNTTNNIYTYKTDAFMAKYSKEDVLEWVTTINAGDAVTTQTGSTTQWIIPDPNYNDIKSQECMYTISELPDGTFVLAGNNSANVDDSYMIKLKSICENVYISAATITESYNFGSPQKLEISSVIYKSTANGTAKSVTEVGFLPGFEANQGSNFSSYITSDIKCTNSVSNSLREGIVFEEDFNNHYEITNNIYPNPSSGVFHWKNNLNVSNISVFDINGLVLAEFSAISDNQMNISNLKNGVYFISYFTGNDKITDKIYLTR